MNADVFARVRDVFHEVIAIEAADAREARLAELTTGDEPLRHEVQTLLAAEAAAGQFLEVPHPSVDGVAPPLTPGTRVGPFEIEAIVGEGGMGRVYRARDTRLDRIVALKVLAHSTGGSLGHAWLRHEARLLSRLNHPHICILHDIVDAGPAGAPCLVMEYLEGETLEERLARGAARLDEAWRISEAMASALDAAHRAGVVHGDLKPANVMLLEGGRVKLLDFGLARAVGGPAAARAPSLSLLPGGTPAYMAPEQARGSPPDARSDLFAFGRVLERMLDAAQAAEPSDPRVTGLRWLAERCQGTDPDERWQSARDIVTMLAFLGRPSSGLAGAPRRLPHHWAWLAGLVAGVAVVAGLVGWALAGWRAPAVDAPLKASLVFPEDVTEIRSVRLSPNGRTLFVNAVTRSGIEGRLHDLRTGTSRRLEWWNGPIATPQWSPDGTELLAASSTGLRAWHSTTGESRLVAPLDRPAVVSWSTRGTILVDPGYEHGPLSRVPAEGGTLVQETRLADPEERAHRFPHFLPDGRHYLFVVMHPRADRAGTYLGRLGTAERWRLSPAVTPPSYMQGAVVWADGSQLVSQPLDIDGRRLLAWRTVLARDVRLLVLQDFPMYTTTASGDLAVPVSPQPLARFSWHDAIGRRLSTVGEPGVFDGFSLASDGTTLLVSTRARLVDDWGLWTIDLARNVTAPLRREALFRDPRWSPDGRQVLASMFNPLAGQRIQRLVRIDADGQLHVLDAGEPTTNVAADGWTPDGRHVLYHVDMKRELRIMPVTGGPSRVLASGGGVASAPARAVVSPDGRWFAYQATHAGRLEVWLDKLDAPGRPVQLSAAGGKQPTWRADGRELYFLAADGTLNVVGFRRGERLAPLPPRPLFQTGLTPNGVIQQYMPAPTGDRFLVLRPEPVAERPRVDLFMGVAVNER